MGRAHRRHWPKGDRARRWEDTTGEEAPLAARDWPAEHLAETRARAQALASIGWRGELITGGYPLESGPRPPWLAELYGRGDQWNPHSHDEEEP